MERKVFVNFVLVVTAIFIFGFEEMRVISEEPEVKPQSKEEKVMSVQTETFGKMPNGNQVDLYTLTNLNGLRARITNYGAILVSIEVPDRDGRLADVTLGFDTLDGYLKEHPYFGAIVGRYANRIGKGKFVLNGVEYKLAVNNGPNHLHGGIKGFDKVLWKLEDISAESDKAFVRLSYLSKDGEEGYPGRLACTVTYMLTKDDELKISYEAKTDKTTVINLTNHTYWNLAGQGNGDVLGHELILNADKYTPVDNDLIPTGEIKSVKDSPMDFTKPMTIGSRIKQVGNGYDHNYVLNPSTTLRIDGEQSRTINSGGGVLALAARVYEPTSGRVMEILTTEPGVQFYTANWLSGSGKSGKVYKKHYAFCLETQHFPDSPNKPEFPSVVLNPGQKYSSETIHKFYTK